MPDVVQCHAVDSGLETSAEVRKTGEEPVETFPYQSAMLRVRAYSGRVICTIKPAEHNSDAKGRVLHDLTIIASLHLHVPATRISSHPIEGCEQAPLNLNPSTTWADCEHLVDTTVYELMAVVRHYRDGGAHDLSLAIKLEQWNEVHNLLEDFVDPSSVIRDDEGYGRCSPLSLAAHTNLGCSCIAEALLKAHADIESKDFEKSPLVAACESQNLQTASFLIHEGADVNRPTWFTDTPLLIAASVNSAPLLRLLLQNRASIHQQDPRQRGPIERAFQDEAVRAAKCLVQANAQELPCTNENCLPRGRKQGKLQMDQAAD